MAAAEDRIVQPVDRGRTAVLRNHVPLQAQPRYDQGPVQPSLMLRYATLRLKPPAALEPFLADQRSPASANYHRWLSPEQFGERFGLSQNDLGKLVEWLQSEGLQVHDIARGRHWSTFSGTADQVGRAFHTQIHHYQVNGEAHFANPTDPSIPAAFDDVVSGVEGLDDFGLQPLYRTEKPGRGSLAPDFTSGANRYLAPDDFATIYNVTPLYRAGLDGSGQKIAVIGASDIDVADVRLFRTTFNLPPNDPQMVLVGPNPGIRSSFDVEANLDIQWSGAVAPNAAIVYVYATSVNTAAQYAIDQKLAPIITFSYGGCEAYNSVGLRAVAQQANAQGITWLAASGDLGAATCDITSPTPQASKGPTTSFPATIPEITAVGGTEFDDGNGNRYWASTNTANGGSALSYVPERAWNDSAVRNDLSASGGGPSVLFAKPGWQSGPGVPNDNARDTPDISLAASPQHYAYIMYSGGGVIHIGGTSASSPSFAGILALLNQSLASSGVAGPGLGNINPALYRLAQTTPDVFHDITAGDILVPCVQGSPACTSAGMGFAAGPGYDLATGLGSVDAYHLVTEWSSGTSTTTTLTVQPATVSLGDTVQLTAAVDGQGGAPTGTVTFLTNDVSLGSAALTPAGTASLMARAGDLAAENGTVTAQYGGDSVFEGSSGTATIQLNLPAAGSLVVPFVTPNPVLPAGTTWPYTVGLSEKAGVATKLTGFTVDNVNQNLAAWTSTSIPAGGTVRANLSGAGLNAPVTRLFVFSGRDADGQTWRQQLSVPFLASSGPALAPAMTLSSAPATVRQNPQADPTCQWSQQLTIQETGGFLLQLSSLTASGASLTGQIQQLFGTTRLAPYGMLQATVCWDNLTPPATKTYLVTGISELGTPVTATVTTSFAAAADSAPGFSVSPAAVTIPADGTASLGLAFDGAAVPWSASVLPANRTSGWLTVSPRSGAGPGQVVLQASAAGLANGVYRAIVSLEASNAVPQALSVPVIMVVGGSSAMTIDGMGNNASGSAVFAPGMQAAVYGSQLAPALQAATRMPLPFTLSGVSATVNGVSAPLYAVSQGQINLQLPYETGSGTAVLAVNNNGQIASYSFPVTAAAPGIFSNLINNSTGGRGSARPGDVLTIFITGAGDLTPSLATGATPPSTTAARNLPKPRLPLAVTVGGETAGIAFAGNASGLVGITQVNFTVPASAAPGPQQVIVTVGAAASDPVTLTIAPADAP